MPFAVIKDGAVVRASVEQPGLGAMGSGETTVQTTALATPGQLWNGSTLSNPAVEPEPQGRAVIPKLLVQSRLKDMGKLAAMWALLQADPDVFGRWIMQGKNVYRDDAELLAALAHPIVGCTAEQIATVTAPE